MIIIIIMIIINSNFLLIESRASFMTTSNTSEPGDLNEKESLSQANIELQAEKILKVGATIAPFPSEYYS